MSFWHLLGCILVVVPSSIFILALIKNASEFDAKGRELFEKQSRDLITPDTARLARDKNKAGD